MVARKFRLTGGRFGHLRISRIASPTYEVNGKEEALTPEIAILEDRTYAAQVSVVVEVTDNQGKVLSRSAEFPYMLVPIPIYSNYCYYNWVISDNPNITNRRIPSWGDVLKTKNPENPGCQFLLSGTANVVLLFEKGRFNQYSVHVDLNSPHRLHYLCFISESPHSTSSTNLYIHRTTSGSYYIGVNLLQAVQVHEDEDDEGIDDEPEDEQPIEKEEKIKKTDRQPPANVLCVAYAILAVFDDDKKLTMKSVERKFITRMKQTIPAEAYVNCYTAFANTIAQYRDFTVEDILELLYTGTQITGTSKNSDEIDDRLIDLWVYFRDQMFPNWATADQKFEILVMATCRLLLTHIGYIPVTDRNHWATRSLHGPGPMCQGVYRRLHAKMVSTIQEQSKFTSITTADQLARYVQEAAVKLQTRFLHSFKPPNIKMMKGGLTKKPQGVTHKAIAIDASPINNLEMKTILTKTRNSAFQENPSFRNRSVEGSYWKFLCSYNATEDDRCGLTKFLALMTLITTMYGMMKASVVIRNLLSQPFGPEGEREPVVTAEYIEGYHELPVTVDGLPIGFASREYGYGNLCMLKRYGIISNKACVVLTKAGVLEVYVDPHRLMIPVVTCDEGEDEPRIFQDPNWRSMTFDELIQRGYIEYMDNYEIENTAINLAQTYASFHNHRVDVQKWEQKLATVRVMVPKNRVWEKNIEEELQSLYRGAPNAMALHPTGSFGAVAATLSFQHYIQSCRVAYAAKMEGQIILNGLGNPHEHVKSYTSASMTMSTVKSHIPNISGARPQTGGITLTVALIADPLNQEDACIVNRRVVQLGGLRYNRTMVFRHTLDDKEKYGRLVTGEANSDTMRHIGENGIPATGVRVRPGDCILAKYIEDTDGGIIVRSAKNIYLDRDEEGVITEVVTFNSVNAKNGAKKLTVSIKIVLYSQLARGDKVTTRQSQKYTVSSLRNPEDMYFNSNGTVSVALSPACLPTRMTTGTVLEPILGLATALGGRLTDIAGHRDYNEAGIRETLIRNGYNSEGTQVLYSGTTGKRVTAEIFVGMQRVNQLAHIAAEKIQCRSTGKQNKVNRQADASKYGETRNKGQKIGEPERNQLIKYGASFVAQDRMNISCDGVTVVICKVCSSYASFDPSRRAFSCPKCGITSLGENNSSGFARFVMPQTARYTHALLVSLGVVPKLKFVDRETYLNQSATREIDLDAAGDLFEAYD
ncbi:DNA-directed RNA polymerase subunit RPB2 [uncultured virus]|nr:DNA-directed RNA polymerase subunit RPB2 [uncultured virus]